MYEIGGYLQNLEYILYGKRDQMCLGSLKLRILRTSAVKRSASNKGSKSSRQSSLGLDIQVGNGMAFS